MSGFVRFARRHYKTFKKPVITVTSRGLMNINVAAMQQYVKNYNHVVFFYHPGKKFVGLRFSNNETSGSYKIQKARKGRIGYAAALAFITSNNIDRKETRSYELKWDSKEKLYVMDLNQPLKY